MIETVATVSGLVPRRGAATTLPSSHHDVAVLADA